MKRRFAPSSRDLLNREQFRHEPVYCESPHNPDDVLCYGSDDDAYDDSLERQLRIEHQANRFLHGLPMFIASATLQGPFEKESGWENPWRSRSISTPISHKRLKVSPPNGTTTTGVPRRPHGSRIPAKSSFRLPSPVIPDPASDPASDPIHEYLNNDSFSRVNQWRDEVTTEVRVDVTKHKSPAPEQPPTQASETWTCAPQTVYTTTLIQAVADSFEACRQSQLYAEERRRSLVPATSPAANRPVSHPHSDRAYSPLRNYGSLVTPSTRESPSPVKPAPADDEPYQPEIVQDNISSSELSEPPQSISEIHEETVPVKPGSSIVPAKPLVKIGFQNCSDRSFRFRNLGAHPVPAPAPVIDVTVTTARTRSQRRSSENIEGLQQNNSPRFDAMQPSSQNESIVVEHPIPLESIAAGDDLQSSPAEDGSDDEAAEEVVDDVHPDTPGDTSMIDGPTLIPSTVSSDSELSELVSMGNFSSEKQSQNLLQEMDHMPRKLLWPKSEKGTTDTSLSSQSTTSGAGKNTVSHVAKTQRATSPEADQRSEPAPILQGTLDQNVEDDLSDACSQDGETKIELGNGTILGTPLVDRHGQQQSPLGDSIEAVSRSDDVARPIETEVQDATQHLSPPAEVSLHVAEAQSPWVKEFTITVQTLDAPRDLSPVMADNEKLTKVASQASDQSPWAKSDSQLAAVPVPDTSTRAFNPLSSPAQSLRSPLQEIIIPNFAPPQSPCKKDTEMPDNTSCPPPPSTPDLKRSSLPTPDYTHSIRSFRDFMTPSPQKRPTKLRRISANDGHLPSTQNLVDAAVSNPWLRSSQSTRRETRKEKKRVSWAPLPGEEEEDKAIESPLGAELPEEPIPTSTTRRQTRSILRSTTSRVASPPPQSLPKNAEQERFAKHFAAMASRRGAAKRPRSHVVLLPSASQQSCGSPQFEAMAERFLAAEDSSRRPRAISILSDGETRVRVEKDRLRSQFATGGVIPPTEPERELTSDSPVRVVDKSYWNPIDIPDDEEDPTPTDEEPHGGVESQVDDVTDVLQNLDSILENTWEIGESGLLSATGSSSKTKCSTRLSSSARRSFGASSSKWVSYSGAMDDGIWDVPDVV